MCHTLKLGFFCFLEVVFDDEVIIDNNMEILFGSNKLVLMSRIFWESY